MKDQKGVNGNTHNEVLGQKAATEASAQSTEKPQQNQANNEKPQPPGMLRWQGLVGFAVVMVMIVAGLLVFAGPLIKLAIERGGSYYWGAEVNVADVEVNWSPFNLAINEFQATDPNKPSHNSVAFEQAKVSADLFQALLGKTLVHELTISEVSLSQQRSNTGAVTRAPEPPSDKADDEASILSQGMGALPSVEDALAQSDLETVKAGQKLQQTYKTEKAAIEALRKDLPDKKQLAEYQKAVKAISDAKPKTPQQYAKLAEDLKALKKRFKADKAALLLAKTQLSTSTKNIAVAVKTLKDAPQQDWQVLSERYQLNSTGAQNFAESIFGPQAKEYIEMAQQVYDTVKPMLDKMNAAKQAPGETPVIDGSRGRFVHFQQDNPMPDWLVEKAQISVVMEQGHFNVELSEVTAQHWLRDKPTVMTVNSSNLLNSGALALNGQFYVPQQAPVKVDADWQVKGLALTQMAISDSAQFKLNLTKATMALKGNLTYANNRLANNNQLVLNNSVFSGDADNKMGQVMVDILSEIKDLSLDVDTSGDIDSPDMAIKSDLDNTIYQAMKQRLKAELAKFKDKAQGQLQQKLAEQLNMNAGDSDWMSAAGANLNDLDKQLEGLLKSKLGANVQDKLKDKLLNLFN